MLGIVLLMLCRTSVNKCSIYISFFLSSYSFFFFFFSVYAVDNKPTAILTCFSNEGGLYVYKVFENLVSTLRMRKLNHVCLNKTRFYIVVLGPLCLS